MTVSTDSSTPVDYLSAYLRASIRAAVDKRVRELVADANGDAGCCRSCGCLYEEQTNGCKTCWDRHRSYRCRKEGVTTHGAGSYARGCRCYVCRSADSRRRRRLKDRKRAAR